LDCASTDAMPAAASAAVRISAFVLICCCFCCRVCLNNLRLSRDRQSFFEHFSGQSFCSHSPAFGRVTETGWCQKTLFSAPFLPYFWAFAVPNTGDRSLIGFFCRNTPYFYCRVCLGSRPLSPIVVVCRPLGNSDDSSQSMIKCNSAHVNPVTEVRERDNLPESAR
jgi:hypothetical protein